MNAPDSDFINNSWLIWIATKGELKKRSTPDEIHQDYLFQYSIPNEIHQDYLSTAYLILRWTPEGMPMTIVAPKLLNCVIFFSKPYSTTPPVNPNLECKARSNETLHITMADSVSFQQW